MDIEISCCLCSNKHKTTIDLPNGWVNQYETHDIENTGFCPEHSDVKPFTENQCVGCVGGWGECDLWKAFAFDVSGASLSEDDFSLLEDGVCPKRTNGTFGFSQGNFEDLDLSEKSKNSGVAFAKAIKNYIEIYNR